MALRIIGRITGISFAFGILLCTANSAIAQNVVVDAEGKKAALKQGAEVAVIVEADSSATTTKPDI